MYPDDATLTHLLTLGQEAEYGREAITQLEHALQSAALAEADGQNLELVLACLLHDIGHQLYHLKQADVVKNSDDHHELSGAKFLSARFGEAVTAPIRLHVAAKRYLCYVDSEYWASLSPVSKQTLEWQGGIFSPEEAEAFIAQPFAKEAVKLRIWDDLAKVPGKVTPDLAYYSQLLTTVTLQPQPGV